MTNEEKAFLLFLYTETPLHAGGETGFGTVDLPIQRERITRLPVVQGSGVKGALRETLTPRKKDPGRENDSERDKAPAWINELFGPEPVQPKDETKANQQDEGDDKKGNEKTSMWAGALSLLDARLLLFPIRSVKGGWAWATSPIQLQRLQRDLEIAGITVDWKVPLPNEGSVLVGTSCNVNIKDSSGKSVVILEDTPYGTQSTDDVEKLAKWLGKALPNQDSYKDFRNRLPSQLIVMTDTDFTYVGELATEVHTRIRIDYETGTVAKGALWTEETLPSESLLWSLATVVASRKSGSKRGAADLVKELQDGLAAKTRIRLGGDRTIGRGWVGVQFMAKRSPEVGHDSK
ncbi:MAG: type III-B CRISPR module RAMP protein Cmr4 [Myxococcales bacterium]|nr:type III-B CRISPR module RAMP protein Cmr4 [Myxococcales bacterium]